MSKYDAYEGFRTDDGYTLFRTDDGWTDGDLDFAADADGWPLDHNGTRLDGTWLTREDMQ